jgi:glycine dehydrogenase
MANNLPIFDAFQDRHIGTHSESLQAMLDKIGVDSLDSLIAQTVPASIRQPNALQLPAVQTEAELWAHMQDLAAKK